MKFYTREEREEAKAKLPKPVYDFLVSPTLNTIYVGIQKKHNLNIRQLGLFTDIANLTLMGLETESALDTNLHQAMHELSNEGTRELVADINDRVFKEAKRRLQESIPEPSVWSEPKQEAQLSPEEEADNKRRELIENMADDDPELLAAYGRDRIQAEKQDALNKKELEEALEQAKKDPPITETEEEDEDEDEEKETATASTDDGVAPVSNIALQKLAAPVVTKTEEINVATKETGIQRISTQGSVNSDQPRRIVGAPTEASGQETPAQKIYPGGNDPYRESVE